MAPQAGFEPATNRLTADCSTTELLWNISLNDNEYTTMFGHIRQEFLKCFFEGAVQKVMIGDFLDIFCDRFIKNCFWKRLLAE